MAKSSSSSSIQMTWYCHGLSEILTDGLRNTKISNFHSRKSWRMEYFLPKWNCWDQDTYSIVPFLLISLLEHHVVLMDMAYYWNQSIFSNTGRCKYNASWMVLHSYTSTQSKFLMENPFGCALIAYRIALEVSNIVSSPWRLLASPACENVQTRKTMIQPSVRAMLTMKVARNQDSCNR
jgi:hypothetical protein